MFSQTPRRITGTPNSRRTDAAAEIHPVFVFALIFCALFLLHAPLLRLPYFWDEAGYFIPAARDLLMGGGLIPHTTLSNAHPPLVMIWLAAWWKLSAFTPAVTRTAMLMVASFGMLGIFRLAKSVSNATVAAVTVTLCALYPTIFVQSSMAQLDIAAFALVAWAVYFHISHRRALSILCSALAGVAKETTIVVPLTLMLWELLSKVIRHWRPDVAERWCLHARKSVWAALAELLSLVPIIGWYAYHFHRTGHVFGNPDYLRYNVGATITPLRIAIAFGERLWHAFGYMNLFVLTVAMLLALRLPPIKDDGVERPRIDLNVQVVFGLLILATVTEFSVVGGALLARYMIPVIPLVVLMAVATLYRRVSAWRWWTAACALAFVAALVTNPPFRIAPEDNLAYADFVRLHKQAAVYVESHYAQDLILTAWPASDELNRPFLGYVSKPLTVVHVENFTPEEIMRARTQLEAFDVVMAFSTKYEPSRSLLRFAWWRRVQERYFDFHQDLSPETIAQLLGGRVAWMRASGGEWVAIIEIDKIRDAKNAYFPLARSSAAL